MEGCDLISNIDLIKTKILEHSDNAIVQHSTSGLEDLTKELWAQIKPQLNDQIDNELKKLLVEYKTAENITRLIELRKAHDSGTCTWEFTGNATEDLHTLKDMTAKTLEPQFNEVLLEAQGTSSELFGICKQLTETLSLLDQQIAELSDEVRQLTNQMVQNDNTVPAQIASKN